MATLTAKQMRPMRYFVRIWTGSDLQRNCVPLWRIKDRYRHSPTGPSSNLRHDSRSTGTLGNWRRSISNGRSRVCG